MPPIVVGQNLLGNSSKIFSKNLCRNYIFFLFPRRCHWLAEIAARIKTSVLLCCTYWSEICSTRANPQLPVSLQADVPLFPSKCSLDRSDDAKGEPNKATSKAVENKPLLLCKNPKKNFCPQLKVLSVLHLSIQALAPVVSSECLGCYWGPLKSQCQVLCFISHDLCRCRGTFGASCQFLAVVIALGF